MSTFHLDLVAPENVLFSGDVESVIVPGTEGQFEVLKGHAPLMSALKPGVVTIQTTTGAPQRLFVRGGFADVSSEGLTLLAEHAVALTDINPENLSRQIADAQDDVKDATSDAVRRKAQAMLDALRELQVAVTH